MKVYVKYMVSPRCLMMVKNELEKLEIAFNFVKMGVIEGVEELGKEKLAQLRIALANSGLEIMNNKKAIIIERIKNEINLIINQSEEMPKINFSNYLSEKLNYDYTYLSNLFSETEGTTIEHYLLLNKIERVKELIIYNELNLTEIAWKLQYSSVAHLSNQFKSITGLTPSFFKSLKEKKRKLLANL